MPRACASASAEHTGGTIRCTSSNGQPDTLRQFILQARPAEQLHHQERALRVVGVVVEDRDDVRMAQLRAGAALADEPFERRGTLHIREDDLDRHVVAKRIRRARYTAPMPPSASGARIS